MNFDINISLMLLEEDLQLYPAQEDKFKIIVIIPNFVQKKATLSGYTAYVIKGEDNQGAFECERRYSDFDHMRVIMVTRWPGCFIPPLPSKKVFGNMDNTFLEQRRRGLQIYLQDTAKLTHLWYSKQFQTFLRSSGDIEKQLKNVGHENHEDIIKKYDQLFPRLKEKVQDTMIVGRMLNFSNYIKKILPVIVNFKEMALGFIQAKNANAEQFSILLNYVLPEYQKSCLSVYCNQITEGKYIFNEKNDEKLAQHIQKLKELISKQQFQALYHNLQQEEREIESFIETYKSKDGYEQKLKDLKSKEKDLQLEIVKLNAGKQGMFASLKGSIESNKAKAAKQLQQVNEDIKVYSYLVNEIIVLLSYFQIQRFRKQKLRMYFLTIKKITVFQIQFSKLRSQICEHVLQNHNLL